MGRLGACVSFLIAITHFAFAQQPPAMTAVSPIFSQLVMMSYPAGFKVAHERANADRYIREAVPAGESVEGWTQMITVTGAKGQAATPNASAQAFVQQIGAGFQRACPETFSSRVIGATKFDGHDSFVAIVGCGHVESGAARSEAALIVAIKGAADIYTFQWAERGPVAENLKVEIDDKWASRLKALGPFRLCPIVPGEKAPFPSCVNRK